MGKIRSAFRFLFRFAAIWLADAVSLSLTAWFLPGIGLGNYAGLPVWMVAFAAALLLGAVNLVVRPLILLVVMRQGFIVLLVAGFFVNAVLTRLCFPGERCDWDAAYRPCDNHEYYSYHC